MAATLRRPRPDPPADSVFEPVRDSYGLRLALVFGNHAPRGVCPEFVLGRCHHCDIGRGEGARFDDAANLARLAWFRERFADVLPDVAHVVVFNSGSVLNPDEMPPALLARIVSELARLPSVRVVSVDSRERWITGAALAPLLDAAPDRVAIHPTLGLESADQRIRNEVLEKDMDERAVVACFDEIAALGSSRAGLDVNLLLAGPGTTPETALDDSVATARFVWGQGRRSGVPVDVNVEPYYPSVRGRARFPDHPRCPPELVARAVVAVDAERRRLAPAGRVFIGWQDEGHDQEPARRRADLARAKASYAAFNATQDVADLDV